MVVVDAEPAADVQVAQVEALVADLAHEAHHDLRRVAEDGDARDGAAQVAVHADELQAGRVADAVQEPLRPGTRGRAQGHDM